MGKRARISIAMAVYNGERFIQEQLESYLAQTRLPDELVISDNGSKDATIAIVRDFAARASFAVRLHVNETDVGICKNFERAISLCTGDIICLSDSDDVWLPRKLELMEEVFLLEPKVALVQFNSSLVDDALRPLGWTFYDFWRQRLVRKAPRVGSVPKYRVFRAGREVWRAFISHELPALGHGMGFRRAEVRRALPFPEHHIRCFDALLLLAIGSAADVAWLDEPQQLHRIHTTQATVSRIHYGLAQRVKNALVGRELGQFEARIQELTAALEWVKQKTCLEGFCDEVALALIESYRSFLLFRAELVHRRRLARILPVLRELGRGRYHAFAKGVLAAARDLAVPQAV